MSGSFTGFSEDYIRKLNNVISDSSSTEHKKEYNQGSRQEQAASSKAPRARRELPVLNPVSEKCNSQSTEKLDASEKKIIIATLESETFDANMVTCTNKPGEDLPEVSISKGDKDNQSSPTSNRKLNLETIQARQKLIEEQNRKRKELLSKVLADKTKKTLAESLKLKEIQAEFQKLDSLHSSDINILRKQIDLASFDYMEAEKRFFKIEKEYLNSKLDLHLKLDRKELLTEHLCAIIEKNEEKKALKLNEMLSQLNLSVAAVVEDNSGISEHQIGCNSLDEN